LGAVFDLDVLDPEAAVNLMSARVPSIDRAVAREIAAELGWLPLALEQAAAFIDLSEMSAADYLTLLKTRTADILGRGRIAARGDTVATVWSLSCERLEQQRPAALMLLDVCGYLAPEAIPLELFTNHTDLLSSPLAEAAADPLAFSETIAALVDYSLAKRTPSGLQLHRLVQAALRARHLDASRPGLETGGSGERLMEVLADDSPPGLPALATVLRLLRAEVPETIYGAPEAWSRWAVLLPHVLAATKHVDDVVVGSNQELAADIAMLLDRAAMYLQVHARLIEARPLAERALAIDEASYGPDHPEVATDLSTLALILWDLEDVAAARPLMERALAIENAAYGPSHPRVASRLSNLAMILRDLGDLRAAQPLMERALAIDEAAHGPDHPEVAIRLNNLAIILRDRGDPAAARPLAERARAIDETSYGPDHPKVALRLNNLALILRRMGDPARARPLAERALAIDETSYGPEHPKVATSRNNLALILKDLGDPTEARKLMERALAIDEVAYGPNHPKVATRRNNLAMILQDLGIKPKGDR
jgi:tetratricopeptide (TPR) repeat protein